VLGDLRPKSLLHVQTEVDLETGALLAHNHYNTEFPAALRFSMSTTGPHPHRGSEGIPGPERKPVAAGGAATRRLSGNVGAGWIRAARCRSPSIYRMGRNGNGVPPRVAGTPGSAAFDSTFSPRGRQRVTLEASGPIGIEPSVR